MAVAIYYYTDVMYISGSSDHSIVSVQYITGSGDRSWLTAAPSSGPVSGPSQSAAAGSCAGEWTTEFIQCVYNDLCLFLFGFIINPIHHTRKSLTL